MTDSKPFWEVRALLADSFRFVQSAEANRALASVTLDDLIVDQIARNGDSDSANSSQYSPYAITESEETPATEDLPRVDYIIGVAGDSATKMDRLMAIKNSLSAMVEELKKIPPNEVASEEDYTDAAEDSFVMEE